MKKLRSIWILSAAMAIIGTSAGAQVSRSDELYDIHNRTELAKKEAARAELRKQQALARQAEIEAARAEADLAAAQNYGYEGDEDYQLTTTVAIADSKYARRIVMFDGYDYYVRPSTSYYVYYEDPYWAWGWNWWRPYRPYRYSYNYYYDYDYY